MYRFVVDPENQVLPDLAAKLPGRGLWIKADRFSLQSAIEKKLFDKITFDTKVIVAPNSPIDFANPNTAPVIKAGIINGKVIVKKIINLFAPNE